MKRFLKWILRQVEDAGRKINQAEERLYFKDKDERN
jgi:hypothetical protein